MATVTSKKKKKELCGDTSRGFRLGSQLTGPDILELNAPRLGLHMELVNIPQTLQRAELYSSQNHQEL